VAPPDKGPVVEATNSSDVLHKEEAGLDTSGPKLEATEPVEDKRTLASPSQAWSKREVR
jgi:hypothetical protein